MSKINQLQAAALKAPVKKVEPAKAPANKPSVAKPVVAAKAPTKKPVVAKPAANTSPAKPAQKKVAATTTSKVAKPAKVKSPKLKMERDSFTMPKAEYAQFSVLKERLAKLGQPAKKSELLRAGVMQLAAMTDAALKVAMSKVPTIKTGRPNKK
jgi:hypothetical protein